MIKRIGSYLFFFLSGFVVSWLFFRVDILEVIYQNGNLTALYNGEKVIAPLDLGEIGQNKIQVKLQFGLNTPLPGIFNKADFWITNNGSREFLSLSGEKMAIKEFFNVKRKLFSSITYFDGQRFKTTSTKANYGDFAIKAYLRNVSSLKIGASQPLFSLWLRPNWHRDGGVVSRGKLYYLQKPVGLNPASFLSDLFLSLVIDYGVGILTWTLIGVFFLFLTRLKVFSFLLKKRVLPKKIYLASAFFLSIIFFILLIYTGQITLESMPHSQDEVAYLFQAKIFSHGKLYLSSLPDPARKFFDNEFIINNGKWFSKYPPGTSLFLAFGSLFKASHLVNPLFSFLSAIALFYFTKRLYSFKTALLTVLFFAFSPFYLLLGGSYLSHPSALFFSLIAWQLIISIFKKKGKELEKISLHSWLLGIVFGFLFLVRPVNLLVFSLALLIFIIFSKNRRLIIRKTPLVFLGFLPFFAFFLFYNWRLTGSPWLSAFQLYSRYDTLGFGKRGVFHGSEFNWKQGIANFALNFYSFKDMLLTIPFFTGLIFVPLAFRQKKIIGVFLLALFLGQQVLYYFYFHHGVFLGPRYWSEASWVFLIFISQGLVFFWENMIQIKNELWLILFFLVIGSYSVLKISCFPLQFQGYNWIVRPPKIEVKNPSVVLIPSKTWQDYGKFFVFQDPLLEEEIVFAKRDIKEDGMEVEKILAPLFQGYQFIYLEKD